MHWLLIAILPIPNVGLLAHIYWAKRVRSIVVIMHFIGVAIVRHHKNFAGVQKVQRNIRNEQKEEEKKNERKDWLKTESSIFFLIHSN